MKAREMRLFAPLLTLLISLGGCSSYKLYSPGTLTDEYLIFRKGYKGLTFGYCAETDGKKCTDFKVLSYNLEDTALRSQFRQLKFICKIGDLGYLISSDKPGIFSFSYDHHKFIGIPIGKDPVIDYIDQSEVDKLVNLNAVCFSENTFQYPNM